MVNFQGRAVLTQLLQRQRMQWHTSESVPLGSPRKDISRKRQTRRLRPRNTTTYRRKTMQTPPEIEFQGMAGSPEIEKAIAKHLAQLEERWGRVTACRVVLKGPGFHHRKGGLYEVHIHLALPEGREVNVERTPPADERHSDLTFALNDAFKHARRQLQDQVRRAQGQVKHHEGRPIGTVVRLDPSGEFGFLESGDGREIYFHRNSVLDNGFSRLRVGSRVTFAEELGEKGAQATTVKLLGKHGLRI
jgi:cold shock CspA family protein